MINKGLLAGVVAVLVAITVIFGSWYTVDQRERGVILRNGKLVGTALPGLGWKIPLIDQVVKISLETQRVHFDKVNSYSRDQQPADLLISVNYRATEDKVDELYAQFGSLKGYADRILLPKVLAESKIVFGRYNAVTAIQERGRLNQEVFAAITKAAEGPVIIEAVQIENLDFSDAYEKSVEQRMLAEVEVLRLRQNAEREKVQAEITVTQAQAKADAVRREAMAQAEATKLRGDAEATNIKVIGEAQAAAIEARARALGQNPNLVSLVQAERWNGVLPTSMIPGAAVPMISVK